MIILALSVRVLIALATRTVFQPDEYFQALEPAHYAVFGYGHLTWEWLTAQPIRSIAYPSINVPVYWFLRVTRLSDHPVLGDTLLIYGPRVLHGALAALTDISLCRLTLSWLGRKYVSTALFISLTSFFNTLALSRSLANSLETSLTTIALTLYPWDISHGNYTSTLPTKPRLLGLLAFSALACMIRPTNAILWVFLYGKFFWSLRSSRTIWDALHLTTGVVTLSLTTLCVLDTLYYGGFKDGRIIFTPLNFLRTNLTSVSLFYGSNPWHYYLTQGLPILCTTAMPYVLHGIYLIKRDSHAAPLRTMLGAVVWYIGIFSLMGHKEWRFIHPILPVLHLFAAKSVVDLSNTTTGTSKKAHSKSKPSKKSRPPKTSSFLGLPIRRSHLTLLLLTLPISVYTTLFYCSAPISVLSYIRSLPRPILEQGIGFLTPCHSTPGQAYIHRKELEGGKMWSLGCEPPISISTEQKASYRDQTDVFFDSPREYLERYFPSQVDASFPVSPYPSTIPGSPLVIPDAQTGRYPWQHEWPRNLVLFGQLLKHDGVKELLEGKGYKEVWKRGREWEGEGERKGGVRVWEWQKKLD